MADPTSLIDVLSQLYYGGYSRHGTAAPATQSPDLVNALAQDYAQTQPENAARNRLGGYAAWPTLPPLPDNRPSARPYERPGPPRWEREVAETISPTMGAYGLAGLATTATMDARQGKYDPEALTPLAAMAFAPGPKRVWYRGGADPNISRSLSPDRQGYFMGDKHGGAHFSASPEVASEYAKAQARDQAIARIYAERGPAEQAYYDAPTTWREWWSGRPIYKHQFKEPADYWRDANVMPAVVEPRNQIVLDVKKEGLTTSAGEADSVRIRARLQELKDQGFDSVVVRGSNDVPKNLKHLGEPDELVVFNRDNIRPPWSSE